MLGGYSTVEIRATAVTDGRTNELNCLKLMGTIENAEQVSHVLFNTDKPVLTNLKINIVNDAQPTGETLEITAFSTAPQDMIEGGELIKTISLSVPCAPVGGVITIMSLVFAVSGNTGYVMGCMQVLTML